MTDEFFPYDLTEEERLDRFYDDLEQLTGFSPSRHEHEVTLSLNSESGQEAWKIDLDEVFEIAQQYGVVTFSGKLSSVGVNTLRFKIAERWMDEIQ